MAAQPEKCATPACGAAATALCDACLTPRCADHTVYCHYETCAATLCTGGIDCVFSCCNECGAVCCADHINVCGGCSEFACGGHIGRCEDCTVPLHVDCAMEGRCPACHAQRDEFSEAEESAGEDQ